MDNLDKLFNDLVAVSQGDVNTLSRATKQFAREVTAPTTLMPRDSASPPSPSAEAVQEKQNAA